MLKEESHIYMWTSLWQSSISALQDGHTPLSFASTNGHTDVAELLLNNGAKVNLQAEVGSTDITGQPGSVIILHSVSIVYSVMVHHYNLRSWVEWLNHIITYQAWCIVSCYRDNIISLMHGDYWNVSATNFLMDYYIHH